MTEWNFVLPYCVYLRVMLQFYVVDRQISLSTHTYNKDSVLCFSGSCVFSCFSVRISGCVLSFLRPHFFLWALVCVYIFVHLSGSFVHACLCTMLRFHLFRHCAKMCVQSFSFLFFFSFFFLSCAKVGFLARVSSDTEWKTEWETDTDRQTDRGTEREMDTEWWTDRLRDRQPEEHTERERDTESLLM